VTADGSRLLTHLPAEDLLVAGRTHLRGAGLIAGNGGEFGRDNASMASVASGDGVAVPA
jgi:hypothetical protein